MKTSCIPNPKKERLIILHQWQLEACDGNHCAGMLLSFFTYWHDIKLDAAEKAKEFNDVAERHGEERHQDESIFQWHTAEQLEAGLLGLYESKKIAKAIEILHAKGFISIHRNPNPRFMFDRTRHFRLEVDIILEWLANRSSQKSLSKATKGSTVIPKVQTVPTKGRSNTRDYKPETTNKEEKNLPARQASGLRSHPLNEPEFTVNPNGNYSHTLAMAYPAKQLPGMFYLRRRAALDIESRMRQEGLAPKEPKGVWDYYGHQVLIAAEGMDEVELRGALGMVPLVVEVKLEDVRDEYLAFIRQNVPVAGFQKLYRKPGEMVQLVMPTTGGYLKCDHAEFTDRVWQDHILYTVTVHFKSDRWEIVERSFEVVKKEPPATEAAPKSGNQKSAAPADIRSSLAQQTASAESVTPPAKKAKPKSPPKPPPTIEELVAKYSALPAYGHINVKHEAEKAQAWLTLPRAKGRKFTESFFMNWLNNIEPEIKHGPPAPVKPTVPTETVPTWEQVEAWLTRSLAQPKTTPGIRMPVPPKGWYAFGKNLYERIKHLPESEWIQAAARIYDKGAK